MMMMMMMMMMVFRNRVRALSSSLPEAEENERGANSIRMEESFTIHLGVYIFRSPKSISQN